MGRERRQAFVHMQGINAVWKPANSGTRLKQARVHEPVGAQHAALPLAQEGAAGQLAIGHNLHK